MFEVCIRLFLVMCMVGICVKSCPVSSVPKASQVRSRGTQEA